MQAIDIYAVRVKITSWLAAAGAVIGAVVGVVLHQLVWRPSQMVGWYAFSAPTGNSDYLLTAATPGQTLTLHFGTSGGLHSSWWPLLAVTVIIGLATGSVLAGVFVTYRAWQRRTSTPTI